ncbi:hypothetical protein [Burkholderia sp. 572]|uniref:hypothetical protein n=1 Tax=Burkholderia sp. 572 TaxID=3156414 RepID=UPI00339A036C
MGEKSCCSKIWGLQRPLHWRHRLLSRASAATQGIDARGRTLLATLTLESVIPRGAAKIADLADFNSDAVIEVTEH